MVNNQEGGGGGAEGAAGPAQAGGESSGTGGGEESESDVGDNNTSSSQALPAGWEERQDANGRTYYVNHIARTTQWGHPAHNEDSTLANTTSESGADTETEGEASSRTDRQQFNRRNHMAEDNQRAARNSVSDGLQHLNLSGGDGTDSGGAAGPGRTRTLSEGEKPPTKLNTEGLPSGWTMQVAPNGRVFFIDHISKKTTWVDPRNSRPSPLPSQSNVPNRRHQDDLGALPEGWEERVHTDGRIFFIDHNNRVTQWEDPRISNPQIAGQAVPYSRDYKRKYEYLKQQLKKPSNVPNKIEIKVRNLSIGRERTGLYDVSVFQVRRNKILKDSYRQINSIPSSKVH